MNPILMNEELLETKNVTRTLEQGLRFRHLGQLARTGFMPLPSPISLAMIHRHTARSTAIAARKLAHITLMRCVRKPHANSPKKGRRGSAHVANRAWTLLMIDTPPLHSIFSNVSRHRHWYHDWLQADRPCQRASQTSRMADLCPKP